LPKYSVIVPVYNRPDEVKELLDSLCDQSMKDFELVLVEDGSTVDCKEIVAAYADFLDISYYFKPNTGPGDSRNFGMDKAQGDYFLFFDSDCLIPSDYFAQLDAALAARQLDAFGGPDNAHASFSDTQKAINYAMTSFFTTGGIRGGKKQLDKFQPRSFNMGLSRKVYETVGGFGDIHPGEDPDLSYRIMDAGFKVGLISEAYVYHKRRIDFSKYAKQVYKFGVVRVILNKWHTTKKSPVFYLPSLFLLGSIAMLLFGVLIHPIGLFPFAIFSLLIFLDCLRLSKSLAISIMAVFAAFVQLFGYGYGFLKSSWLISILGKEERKALPTFFFDKGVSK
jgi:glycosyltransferase involved in cell wall biosynthesis